MARGWYNHSNTYFHNNTLENFSEYNFTIPLYNKTRNGVINGWQYLPDIKSHLAYTHTLADIKLTSNRRKQYATKWADLDPVENRYIVVGTYDEGISLYDSNKAWATKTFSHLGTIRLDASGSHGGQVTCVQWYPFDAGLITSSSSSKNTVKILDPNPLALVDEFTVSSRVNHHDLSTVASSHSLIATALHSGEVALCDLRTGSSTHHLRRHVCCNFVQWSKHNQNILASGGVDDLICIWDVRSGKACLNAFNEDKLSNSIICSLAYTYDGLWFVSFNRNSKSPLTIWNSKTYKKRNIKIKIPFKFPRSSFRMDFTRSNTPDLLYIPASSEVYVYDLSSGALVNILHAHDKGLLGVIYNPLTGDLYTFGGKKNFMVFSPKFVVQHGKELKEANNSSKRTIRYQYPEKDEFKRMRFIEHVRNGSEQSRNIHEDNWSSSDDD